MKGVVFTEFIEMLEEKFGFEAVDAVIQQARLPSGGAYTSVGLYDDEEMYLLVSALSQRTGIAEGELYKTFGTYLFGRFTRMFPHFVEPATGAFSLLQSVDSFIHVEVYKLYPDTRLPTLVCTSLGENSLQVCYKSHRPMGDFAEGLLRGVLGHFNEDIDVQRTDLDPQKREVEFILTRSL